MQSVSSPHRFSTWQLSGLLIVWLATAVSSVNGQVSPPESATPETPTKPDLRFSIGWVSTGGSYAYVPEKWGELHVNLVNSRNEPRELLCVTSFDELPNLQFGRRVWVPANSKIQVTHPVLIPKCDPQKGRQLNLQSLILDASSTDDVFIKNESGKNLHDAALLVTPSGRNTAIISFPSDGKEIPPSDTCELVSTARISQRLSNRLTRLYDTFLPADETSLDALDHIVIAENRILDDFAALSALRNWVYAGGRLWVMLDQTEPLVLERLLGDDFRGHLVDRVELTTVRVDKAPSFANPSAVLGESIEYEVPVQLARFVAPNNMEIVNTVNGWPAALTMPCGDGQILITTLGPRGWMQPKPRNAPTPADALERSDFVASQPLQDVVGEFLRAREPELLPRNAIEPQVREYIGYSVPSWGAIVGTLILFSLTLIVVSIWVWRVGQIEYLGFIGSGLAIAFSVFLLMIGHSSKHGVSPTIASVQVAQALAGTDDVLTQGLIAVYHPEGSQALIKAEHGGKMLPDMTGLDDAKRRMVTTDLGCWQWENVKQPAGLRATQFIKSETIVQRLEARATLNSNGIIGSYSGQIPAGADALVATRNGRIGASLKSDGSFTARAEDVFEKEQFLNANIVNDEQDRRRRTLGKLFGNPKRQDFPGRPELFFWSDHTENGYRFSEDLKHQGSTLFAIPLVFDRPPDGTEIVIPSPLLIYRNRPSPDGSQPSTMWNYGRNEWQDRSNPGSTWLRFQVPRELLPLAATRGRIDVKVSGPVGKLEFMGLKNGSVNKLKSFMDPVGSLSFEINDPDVLSISEDGGVTLGLNAGDPTRPELTETKTGSQPRNEVGKATNANANAKINYWRIESLTLQLWAKTTEPTAKD